MTLTGGDIQVEFRAWGDRADYGPGTPTDIEITDAEIQAVTGQSAAMVAYYRSNASRRRLSKAAQERRDR